LVWRLITGDAHRPTDQIAETLGQIGPLEELHGVRIVGFDLSAGRDLVEVSRELRGVEVSGGDVIVRLEHLTPRLESDRLRVVDRGLQDLLVVLVSRHAPQVQADGFEVIGYASSDVDQADEPLGGVKYPVRVVIAK